MIVISLRSCIGANLTNGGRGRQGRQGRQGQQGRQGAEVAKIYTKTGDAGETGLLGGSRVAKDHLRVEAYGQVDELNAAIGLTLALEPRTFARELLEQVQRELFNIGAELARIDPTRTGKALREPPIGPEQVAALEAAIDRHETQVPPLKQFILPGAVPTAA